MGNRGILKKESKRLEFLEHFLGQYLKEDRDKTTQIIIRQVLESIMKLASDDQLYFALYPLLIDRIASSPRHSTPWKDVIRPFVNKIVDNEYLHKKILARKKDAKGKNKILKTGLKN